MMWSLIAKAVFMGLGAFMKKKKQDKEFYQSYLEFLEIANRKGYVKVEKLIAGEDALNELKDRVKQRKLKKKSKKKT